MQLAAQKLPQGVSPTMGPISSIMGEILLIGISSRDGATPPIELRSIADWTLRQRLLTIPGVAQVIPIGGGVKQYQVQAIPERMASYGVTLDQVVQAVQESGYQVRLAHATIPIKGMHCAGCVATIERALLLGEGPTVIPADPMSCGAPGMDWT